MEFRVDSEMTAILVVQTAGGLLAIIATLLPYPITATAKAKRRAAQTARLTAELLLFATKYYCGSKATVTINIWNSQLERNRADMREMRASVNSAWWEGFDIGSRGIVRRLLGLHVKMI